MGMLGRRGEVACVWSSWSGGDVMMLWAVERCKLWIVVG